jgi:hypothetical protein
MDRQQVLDVPGDDNRLDFDKSNLAIVAPGEEVHHVSVVRFSCVPVPNRSRKELDEAARCSWSLTDNDRGNLPNSASANPWRS